MNDAYGAPSVTAFAVSGTDLYAGGYFTMAGGVGANRVARWDGASWWPLGSGASGTYPIANALTVRGNALFAGGSFSIAGGKVSGYFAEWQPRVNVNTVTVSATPGAMTIGNDCDGFYKPALVLTTGTAVTYPGGLPTSVTLDRAEEIQVAGRRVNGAFTLSPDGMQFGGDGTTVRVEFSEDDAALFGRPYTDFRAMRLDYPAGYPATKEAATKTPLAGQGAPVPVRIENGRQIYSITAPLAGIASTYGAIPEPAAGVGDWPAY